MNTSKQIPGGSAFVSALMLAAALVCFEIPSAIAQTDDYSKYGLSVGLFVTDRNSSTRFDAQGSTTNGTEVDLESELGLDTSDSVFRLDGYFRFNQKHRLDFS